MAKIVLFGQAKFGEEVFKGLVAAGHQLSAVAPPPRRRPDRIDPLEQAGIDAGLRIVQRKSYRGAEALAATGAADADLCVLAYVTQIIPSAILDAPTRGSICFHPSLLPAYRGGSAIPWQLINGETVGGVCLFRPDDGMDTGPIYLTRELEIGREDSAASYYYGKVFAAGVAATLEAAELALSGATPVTQEESLASYQPLLSDAYARVSWGAGAGPVHNLVRGCDPAPGAWCKYEGGVVRLYGSSLHTAAAPDADAGTVVAVGAGGLEVAAPGGTVRFAKIAGRDVGKSAAPEAAAALGIKPGSRLS